MMPRYSHPWMYKQLDRLYVETVSDGTNSKVAMHEPLELVATDSKQFFAQI